MEDEKSHHERISALEHRMSAFEEKLEHKASEFEKKLERHIAEVEEKLKQALERASRAIDGPPPSEAELEKLRNQAADTAMERADESFGGKPA